MSNNRKLVSSLASLSREVPRYDQIKGKPIGELIGADFNITTDQSIPIVSSLYVIRRIVVTNVSLSLTTAAGGLYTGASKTGVIVVAAAQVYTALTAAGKFLDLTLDTTPLSDVLTASTLFFSLTTAQGAAATGDIFLFGDILD